MTDAETTIPASDDSTLRPEMAAPEYRSKQDQVAAILEGADSQPPAEPPTPPETDGQAEPQAEMPGDLAALAERLGAAPESLYGVKVPLADGQEPVTLGQLKDAWRDAQALEQQRTELTRQRGEWHADQLRAQRELDTLISAIPPEAVKPELRATVEKVNRERISRETEALLRAVPEWSDAATVKADLQAMTAHLGPYGITAEDLQALTDHRLLRYFRDQAKLASKLATTPSKPPVKASPAPRRAPADTPALQAGRLRQAVQSGKMRPADAVAALLNQRT